MSKSKLANLQQLETVVERDLRLGSEGDNLKDATINLYKRQLKRVYTAGLNTQQWDPEEFVTAIQHPGWYNDAEFQKTYKVKNSNIIKLLFSIYKSEESLILTLNALCKMVKNRYKQTFNYYNSVRKVLSKHNKEKKLNNELSPEEEKKYISYNELMAVPEKVKSIILQKFGKLFLTFDEFERLKRGQKSDYLQLLFDYFTLYLNVHYPIRLVWPSVLLEKPAEKAEEMNYLVGNKLHLNDFKNVRMMEAQELELDSSTMVLINNYLNFLSETLHQQPTKLLWRLYNKRVGEYDYTSKTSGGFSNVLSRLFMKYNGKAISMNVIRHIVESHIIQSPNYSKLTNKEKNDLHAKLLHSAQAANISYNKIANRNRQVEAESLPDMGFEPEEAPATPPPAPPASPPRLTRGKPKQMEPLIPISVRPVSFKQKRRLFTGSFTPTGSNRDIEIEIFEKH